MSHSPLFKNSGWGHSTGSPGLGSFRYQQAPGGKNWVSSFSQTLRKWEGSFFFHAALFWVYTKLANPEKRAAKIHNVGGTKTRDCPVDGTHQWIPWSSLYCWSRVTLRAARRWLMGESSSNGPAIPRARLRPHLEKVFLTVFTTLPAAFLASLIAF